jgi:peroxiredoxin (alkyl hydroperoxide reductase subunit C)
MKQREYIPRVVGCTWPRWVRDQYFAVEKDASEASLASFTIDSKWKVFYFYAQDFNDKCAADILEFDKYVDQFEKLNAVVFGISPDNEKCKLAWKQSNPSLATIKHTLVVDSGNELAQECSIATEEGIPIHATFIVDPDDIIQYVGINNYSVTRNAEEVVRILTECINHEKKEIENE